MSRCLCSLTEVCARARGLVLHEMKLTRCCLPMAVRSTSWTFPQRIQAVAHSAWTSASNCVANTAFIFNQKMRTTMDSRRTIKFMIKSLNNSNPVKRKVKAPQRSTKRADGLGTCEGIRDLLRAVHRTDEHDLGFEVMEGFDSRW